MARISDLPDDVLYQIVSLLSAKDAANTKLLSKNYVNLIYIIPKLEFSPDFKISESFRYFVDWLSTIHGSHRLRRFLLNLPYLSIAQYNLVNDCLINVMKRGVLDLVVDIRRVEGGDYTLPIELFTCNSVEKLKLSFWRSSFVIDMIPQNALLLSLKTLILVSVRFDASVFQRVISACPVLEELLIDGYSRDHWTWCGTVSSQSLKRLTIRRRGGGYGYRYDINSELISFDTPRLEYLEYLDILRGVYPVVNIDSLVEAKLQLPPLYDGEQYHLTNLINGLKNVQTLTLDYSDTMPLIGAFFEIVPVFENLLHLSLNTERNFCWNAMVLLLEKSPNLKSLTIEGTLRSYSIDNHRNLSEYSSLLSCPIGVLKITSFKGEIGEMVQLKHFLQKLPCLEVLEIHVLARSFNKKMLIMLDLLMLPKASSKCKLQLKFP